MRRPIAVGLIAALLLAGCARLPTDGPVTAATPRPVEDPGFEVIVKGPQENETPREIVDGFLLASRFGTGEFDSARDFLTAEAAETWEPTTSVYIYSAEREPVVAVEEDSRISVSVNPIAVLDEDGRYQPLADAERTADFTLVADGDGQWRIAALDDGVMISDLTFSQTYVAAPLQFISLDESALVPELRWYPHPNAATMVVEGLLEGPSGWLSSGVTTAFPRGTTLGPGGVRSEGSAVTVDLSADAWAAQEHDVPMMREQLRQSLASLADIAVVDVTVMGQALDGAEPVQDFTLPQSVSAPYMLQGDTLVRWINGELEVVNGSEELLAAGPRTPAIPYAESSAPIVIVAGGTELRTVGTETVAAATLYTGEDLVAPSYDLFDWVWTTSRISEGTLVAASAAASPREISATWLAGMTVRAVRVSPGGDRVAIVTSEEGVDSLNVAVVLRDISGAPYALSDPLEIAPTLNVVHDVTWVDQTTIGALAATSASASAVLHLVSVGGPTRARPLLAAAESLSSARSERSIVMVTDEGALFERTGSGWRSLASGVRDPAYSG